jgi:hypothetical protein
VVEISTYIHRVQNKYGAVINHTVVPVQHESPHPTTSDDQTVVDVDGVVVKATNIPDSAEVVAEV